ncbi:MAG: tryptophan--tRNA ligase, partial [Ignavibacteria bacterium]|nr:tryptophan--tRNA ligase [Ignavibacteria bacterium]
FDCKMNCASKISQLLEPVREKRQYYETRPDEVKQILKDGEDRARKAAIATMSEVREKMKLG